MDGVLVKEAALHLPPAERVHLIDALWASLDPADQADVDRTWVAESLDRLRAFREGHLVPVDGCMVLDQVERVQVRKAWPPVRSA